MMMMLKKDSSFRLTGASVDVGDYRKPKLIKLKLDWNYNYM
jgi:hypothetical protein